MTTATEQMTWENLRLVLLADANKAEGDTSRATDEQLRELARDLGVRSSGNRTAVLNALLAQIGKQPDLRESVKTDMPEWAFKTMDEVYGPEDETPPFHTPPAREEAPEDEHTRQETRQIVEEAGGTTTHETTTHEREYERSTAAPGNTTLTRLIMLLIGGLALAGLFWLMVETRPWTWLGWGEGTQVPTSTSATATPAPGTNATATAIASDTGTMPELPTAASHGKWTIQETAAIDKDPIVRDFMSRLKDPDPSRWTTFPNIPNPKLNSSEFPVRNGNEVPWGAEYGVPNVPFCQQDTRCDFVVPALHYRLITADYSFQGTTCKGDGKKGCLLLLVNVGNQTQIWRNQMSDNGFSVPGRYWDGDHLDTAMWGLVSHASANMLNMPTMASPDKVLNAGGATNTNGGSNCGVPNACSTVDATIVVHAGDRILAVAKSTVTR